MSTKSKTSLWRMILRNEKLDITDCLRVHYRFGFLLLALGVFLTFSLITNNNQKLPLPRDIILAITSTQIIFGLILSFGVFFKKSNPIIVKRLLTIHGALICILVFAYTVFMSHTMRMILSDGSLNFKIVHPPGLLTFFSCYSCKLILDFSGLFQEWVLEKKRALIILSIGLGLICDLILIWYMIQILRLPLYGNF